MRLIQRFIVFIIATCVGSSIALAQKTPDGTTGDPPLSSRIHLAQKDKKAEKSSKDSKKVSADKSSKLDRARRKNGSTGDPPGGSKGSTK